MRVEQTVLAGAAGHFDHVTVHPYEILDLVEDGCILGHARTGMSPETAAAVTGRGA
jgi:hypothetical protein